MGKMYSNLHSYQKKKINSLVVELVDPSCLGLNLTQICHLPAMWPWATLLSLSVPQYPHL